MIIKQISITWSIEDVQSVRPDLSDYQAYNVLKSIQEGHDASIGVNWDIIKDLSDDKYPKGSFLYVSKDEEYDEEIEIVWHVDDVKNVRPDLTDREASKVLIHVMKNHDANIGINWETFKIVANALYPLKKKRNSKTT